MSVDTEEALLKQLPFLQDRIRRDREGYRKEFETQYARYEMMMGLADTTPSQPNKALGSLVNFLSHVVPLFKEKQLAFSDSLHDFVHKHHLVLERNLRAVMVSSLVLLRNRQILDPVKLLRLCFVLFRCADKSLRTQMHQYIVADVKNVNRNAQNQKLNKALQNYLYTLIDDTNPTAAHKSISVMIDLYKKGIWSDVRTANVIAQACFSSHLKVRRAALFFFVGDDNDEDEDAVSSDEDLPNPSQDEVYKALHRKYSKSSKREKKMRRVLSRIQKRNRKKENNPKIGFSALQQLHDSQTFVEKLFSSLRRTTDKFEMKLQMMRVISRLIGMDKLLVLGFYPFMQRYLKPSQAEITHILICIAQACHEIVPPDAVEPLITTLVHEFVNDRSSPEAQASGLNTVREICLRCPTVMTPELLQDLVMYKKDRDKSVKSAARGLMQLFRNINPELLKRRDRGKEATMSEEPRVPLLYGQRKIAEGVAGIELLAQEEARLEQAHKSQAKAAKRKSAENNGSDDDDDDDDDDNDGNSDGSGSHISIDFGSDDDDDDDSNDGSDDDDDDGSGDDGSGDDGDDGSGDDGDDGSDDGDDSDLEIMDGSDDDDDDGDDAEEPLQVQQIDRIRVLSDADFEKLADLKSQLAEGKLKIRKRKRRQESESESESDGVKERVTENDIIGWRKKQKATKEERVQSIMAGREGRKKFGQKQQKAGGAGLSHKEKSKKKAPSMIKRSKARGAKLKKLKNKNAGKQFKGRVRKF